MANSVRRDDELFRSLLQQARRIAKTELKRSVQIGAFTKALEVSGDLSDFETAWAAMSEKDYDHDADLRQIVEALAKSKHLEKSREVARKIRAPGKRVEAFAAIYQVSGGNEDLLACHEALAALPQADELSKWERDDPDRDMFFIDLALAKCGDPQAAERVIAKADEDVAESRRFMEEFKDGMGGPIDVRWMIVSDSAAEIAAALARAGRLQESRNFASRIRGVGIADAAGQVTSFVAIYRITGDPADLAAAKSAAEMLSRQQQETLPEQQAQKHSSSILERMDWLDATVQSRSENEAWAAILEVSDDPQMLATLKQRMASGESVEPETLFRIAIAEYLANKDREVLNVARQAAHAIWSPPENLEDRRLDALLRIYEVGRFPGDLNAVLGTTERLKDPYRRVLYLCRLARVVSGRQ